MNKEFEHIVKEKDCYEELANELALKHDMSDSGFWGWVKWLFEPQREQRPKDRNHHGPVYKWEVQSGEWVQVKECNKCKAIDYYLDNFFAGGPCKHCGAPNEKNCTEKVARWTGTSS